MTQLHAIHHGIDAVRPTNDVDIVLHIETGRHPERDRKCPGVARLRDEGEPRPAQ